jgi:hypothetical protein
MNIFKLMNSFLFGFSMLLVMSGCGGGGSSGGSGTDPTASNVYINQDIVLEPQLSPSILQFLTTATGSVSPNPKLKGSAGVAFIGLAVDGLGNLYVGGTVHSSPFPSAEILVYAPGASGTATPSRTIAGASTGLDVLNESLVYALALDSSGNIYVSSYVNVGGILYPGVSIFSASADGNVAPTKVIAGSATTISGFSPGQIAVDSANHVYTAGGSLPQPDSILIFNSSSPGNGPPTSSITGSNTMIEDVVGIALDSEGKIYVANGNVTGVSTPSILVFSAGSTGNVAPIRTISGSATTISSIGNLALDSAGNIYVLNDLNLLKFAANATGNAAPIGTITTSPGLLSTNSIAVR